MDPAEVGDGLAGPVARLSGHRQGVADLTETREGARGHRVIDRAAFRIRERQCAPQLHGGHPGRRGLRKIAGQVLEVGNRYLAGLTTPLRLPLAAGSAELLRLGQVSVGDDALVAERARTALEPTRPA